MTLKNLFIIFSIEFLLNLKIGMRDTLRKSHVHSKLLFDCKYWDLYYPAQIFWKFQLTEQMSFVWNLYHCFQLNKYLSSLLGYKVPRHSYCQTEFIYYEVNQLIWNKFLTGNYGKKKQMKIFQFHIITENKQKFSESQTFQYGTHFKN